MRFLRRIGIWLVASIMLAATVAFAACGGEDSEKEKETLTLDKTEISMLVADETTIEATYEERDGQTLVFVSSDEAVVSVTADGKVTANKKGTATITATYGNATATCAVNVSLGSMFPELQLTEIEGDSVSVMTGDTLNFASQVAFNGKNFTDATVEYSVDNAEIASISTAGVLTPIKVGATNVTVTATWRGETGATLSKTVAVTVMNNVSVYVNDGTSNEIVLYTAASFCGQTYATESPFVAHAFENGTEKTCVVDFADGSEQIVTFADGKITAVGAGETVATISFVSADNQTYSEEITVKVLLPEYTYGTPVNFSAADGYLPLADIFGTENVTIISASEGETALTLDSNRITSIVASKTEILEKAVVLTTAEGKVNVVLKVYTKVLTQAADLLVFDLATAETKIYGTYLLGNDIDASTIAANTHKGITNASTPITGVGFGGVFDGNGKTLKFNFNTVGLFGFLLDGAVIKNVIFDGTQTLASPNKRTPSLIANNVEYLAASEGGVGVKIENVYAKIARSASITCAYNTSLIGTRTLTLQLSNVVVENLSMDATKAGGALFFADAGRNYYDDSATDNKLAKVYKQLQENITNVYVISNSNFMTQWGKATVESDGFINVKALVAGNYTIDKNAIALLDNMMERYTGVTAYQTYAELSADANFVNLPWKAEESGLVWKS